MTLHLHSSRQQAEIPNAWHRPPDDLASLFSVAMNRQLPKFNCGLPELRQLNIGAGFKGISGAEEIGLPYYDAETMPIPSGNESVGNIYCFGMIDHVKNVPFFLSECQRVLAPGGVLNIWVAHFSSDLANEDLDHKSRFTEESWKVLFRNKYWANTNIEWKFEIGINVLMAVAHRNLSIITQLIRTK